MTDGLTRHNNVISFTRKRRQAEQLVEDARRVFREQASAISALSTQIGPSYMRAIHIILNTRGHVVICGIGKSGLIGQKIAATFASTGTPSFFLHPAEAYHGDLGMLTAEDTILFISNSGETDEIIRLIPFMKQMDIPIISMVGRTESTLAEASDAVLNIAVEREACPNNLAPTNSTLATLAMGDALAVSLIKERNFMAQDFARFHPGGRLGRKLVTRVRDVMHGGDLPTVSPNTSVQDSLMTITQGRLGLTLVMKNEAILGIVTDGDLRRALQKHRDLSCVQVDDIMTRNPKTISEDALLSDAEEKMRRNKIKALVVLDNQGKVSGILEIFDD